LWQAADKIVYSSTLDVVASGRTRIERDFDVEVVRSLKAGSAADLAVGGAGLAGGAMSAGLVDELYQLIAPVIVGSGQRWLPADVHIDLDLVEERRFSGGFVFLRYRTHH